MSRPTRTFVAVPIPRDRAEKLQRLQTLIAPSLPNARWEEPDKFHVTLAFLGDVPDVDLSPICRAVAEAVKGFPRFELAIEKLGVFPNPSRPRVVWAGLTGDGVETLSEIQRAVVTAVDGLGYAPEDTRFTPHITLGRLKPGKDPTDDCSPLLRHFERWMGGSFGVPEIITYASQFTAEGPAYVPLGRAPLKGR
ncbi:MAG: 2,3-cyclic phosphodiesterase [Planctomycetota bacterium]|nr:2,3-cyclic phosphodiesterase [Planctomycetota bacterium]